MSFEEHFEKIGEGYITVGKDYDPYDPVEFTQFIFVQTLEQEELEEKINQEMEEFGQEQQMRERDDYLRESKEMDDDDYWYPSYYEGGDEEEDYPYSDPEFRDYELSYEIYEPEPFEKENLFIEMTLKYNNQSYRFKLYENQNNTELRQSDYIGKIEKFNGFTGPFGFECEETTIIVKGFLKRLLNKDDIRDIIKIVLLKPI